MKKFLTIGILAVAATSATACGNVSSGSGEPTTVVVTVIQAEATQAEATQAEQEQTQQPQAELSTEEKCNLVLQQVTNPKAQMTFCDGRWVKVGVPFTDHVVFQYWNGTTWEKPQPMGRINFGMDVECYSPELLAKLAPIPPEIYLSTCEPGNYNPV